MTELKSGRNGPTGLELDLAGKSSRLGNRTWEAQVKGGYEIFAPQPHTWLTLFLRGKVSQSYWIRIRITSVVYKLINVTE